MTTPCDKKECVNKYLSEKATWMDQCFTVGEVNGGDCMSMVSSDGHEILIPSQNTNSAFS